MTYFGIIIEIGVDLECQTKHKLYEFLFKDIFHHKFLNVISICWCTKIDLFIVCNYMYIIYD